MRTHRLERVASTIRSVLGEAIAHRLNDPRIMPMTSVTRVEVSGDLMHARVYVSVMGTSGEQQKTMDGLHHSTLFLQNILARHLKMRHCPRIRFLEDSSIKGAMETIRIIDETVNRAVETGGDVRVSPEEMPGGGREPE